MKGNLINRVHPIVEIVDLPPTVNLAENSFLNEAIIVRLYVGLDWDASFRCLIDDTHVANSRQRHVERPRNRRCGECDDINLILQLL